MSTSCFVLVHALHNLYFYMIYKKKFIPEACLINPVRRLLYTANTLEEFIN